MKQRLSKGCFLGESVSCLPLQGLLLKCLKTLKEAEKKQTLQKHPLGNRSLHDAFSAPLARSEVIAGGCSDLLRLPLPVQPLFRGLLSCPEVSAHLPSLALPIHEASFLVANPVLTPIALYGIAIGYGTNIREWPRDCRKVYQTKMVHYGPKWSILVHLGLPTVLWPFLNYVFFSGIICMERLQMKIPRFSLASNLEWIGEELPPDLLCIYFIMNTLGTYCGHNSEAHLRRTAKSQRLAFAVAFVIQQRKSPNLRNLFFSLVLISVRKCIASLSRYTPQKPLSQNPCQKLQVKLLSKGYLRYWGYRNYGHNNRCARPTLKRTSELGLHTNTSNSCMRI